MVAGIPAAQEIRAISFSAAPRRGAVSIIEIAVLASCIVAAVVVSNRYAVDIMIRTFLWAGLALAWNIAGGYAGLISFGHAAFFGIGAYTSTILLLNYGVPPWFGMFAGALIAGCAGALLTQVCARLRGPFFTAPLPRDFVPWGFSRRRPPERMGRSSLPAAENLHNRDRTQCSPHPAFLPASRDLT